VSDQPKAPKRLQLLILTPDQVLFRGPVLWVQVPLEDGLLGIWPGHAALVGMLGHGVATYDTGDGTRESPIAGGILRVASERCSLLTVAAEEELPEEKNTDASLAMALEAALEEHLTEQELAQIQELDT